MGQQHKGIRHQKCPGLPSGGAAARAGWPFARPGSVLVPANTANRSPVTINTPLHNPHPARVTPSQTCCLHLAGWGGGEEGRGDWGGRSGVRELGKGEKSVDLGCQKKKKK